MKIKRLNEINKFEIPSQNKKEFYQIWIRGDTDIRESEFHSFDEAMNFLKLLYSNVDVMDLFGQSYKIYKITKEETYEEFEIWKETKKFNL